MFSLKRRRRYIRSDSAVPGIGTVFCAYLVHYRARRREICLALRVVASGGLLIRSRPQPTVRVRSTNCLICRQLLLIGRCDGKRSDVAGSAMNAHGGTVGGCLPALSTDTPLEVVDPVLPLSC